MKLVTATPTRIPTGHYNMSVTMTAGTSKLQFAVDGGGFNDVPDSAKTATDAVNIWLPDCRVQSVLTGDAELSLNVLGTDAPVVKQRD